MPAVTTAPSVEACLALVNQINAGTAYTLAVNATSADQFADDQQDIDGLRVDVVHLDEMQVTESLDVEDRSTHSIGIEIRRKITTSEQRDIDDTKLIVRQIFQRVNDYDSSDNRVRVWDCGYVKGENPNKQVMAESMIFRSRILLRVEVEVPA